MACEIFHKPSNLPGKLTAQAPLSSEAYFYRMRNGILGLVLLLAMGDSCSNGVVGVQDYGSVSGRVLDATTNKPIANAIVSVGSLYTATADAQGGFMMPHVPIGDQEVTARAPGFTTATQDVRVRKDKPASAGYLRIVPLSKPESIATLPPPPLPATPSPTPIPTYVPPSPSPSAEVSATP